jgi:tetratricopeptide (TPR) repeat protein
MRQKILGFLSSRLPVNPLDSAFTPMRVTAALVFSLLGAIGFLPLFGGPGYEQSLASGLIVPSAAAIAVALGLSASADVAPLACLGRGLLSGASLAGVAFATALLHGLRVGICDPWGGATFFSLTAGFGALMGGAWGALTAEVCRTRQRRRMWCVLIGLSGPLCGIGVSLARFYGSPMIFAYDPFFGYFSGTLYDTVVDVRTGLWTYRAGSFATLAGAALVASVLARAGGGRLAVGPMRDRPVAVRAILGLAALIASAAVTIEGPALGHWQTSSTIAKTLGGWASGPRCDVAYPDSLLARQAALLVRDCEQELAADEQRLGTRLDGRLTAFVFSDANQKRELMGAADTSIAKPWRREVYVQTAGFPHPVLGHEIAHVVAGSFARWPLRVGGGILPDPGLIEGVAVAASPDDDELSGAQWARAMLDLGILPRSQHLFSLDFLGESAAKSYTAAGAFVAWVLDRWGGAVMRAWYGGASIEKLTRRSWSALDADFRAWLRTRTMPDEAIAYARAKFERPSVWARLCPHVVDALDRAGDGCSEEHRFARAAALYDRALARDPRDWHALLNRARIETWHGDEARGRDELTRIEADDQAPRTWRDRAQEALADDDLARGRDLQAVEAYRSIAARTLDEDAARTLEVKALAAGQPGARRAIIDLLVGEPGRPLDTWLGALSMGEWAAETREPLAAYLVGKNLARHQGWTRAADWLDRAVDAGLQTARLGRAALRERAICACALDDREALAGVRDKVLAHDSPFVGSSGGRREWLLLFISRCEEAVP